MENILSFDQFLNEAEEVSFATYSNLLGKHDWTYMMSDDDNVYKRGAKEEEALRIAYSKLDPEEKKKGFELYKKLHKDSFPESTSKYEFEKFRGA